MAENNQPCCPKCGSVLLQGVADGLCMACLLSQGLEENREDVLVEDNPDESVLRYFGDYELLEELARGGMGVVYRARQTRLNRIVALKILVGGDLASTQTVERFRTETEAVATLDHPNIVPIFEVGEKAGQYFFTMKMVEGGSLSDHMRDWRLPEAGVAKAGLSSDNVAARQTAIARLMVRVARAVDYAHQHGILHRDLKPGNILLDTLGEPFLTDFGLAKLIERDSSLTHTHAFLGTPAYMPPEQAAGQLRSLTIAADVYGLGAVLYELLTGRPPFVGASALDTMRKVIDEEPRRPSSINKTVDPDLEVISLKCLEKDPQRRYPSAQAMAEELECWLRHEPIKARPVSNRERALKWARRRPMMASLMGVTAAALLALVVIPTLMSLQVIAANKRANREVEVNRKQLVQFHVRSGVDLMKAGNLMGALPWFVKALEYDRGIPEREHIHRIRIRAALNHSPRLVQMIFHPTNASAAYFGPRGKLVVVEYKEAGMARIFDVATGQPVTPMLRHDKQMERPCFNAGGDRLLTSAGDGVAQIWETSTGDKIGPAMKHGVALYSAAFSSDDKTILTIPHGQKARIWDAETGAVILTISHEAELKAGSFSPDGQKVLTADRSGRVKISSAITGETEIDFTIDADTTPRSVGFSGDGRRFFVALGEGVFVFDSKTGQSLGPVRSNNDKWIYGAALTHDGSQLITYGRDAFVRVWGVDNELGNFSPLPHGHDVRYAEFSADDNQIVSACDDQQTRLWTWANGEIKSTVFHNLGDRPRATLGPHGRLLMTTDTRITRIWDLANNAQPGPNRWDNRIASIHFSADGQRVVSVDQNRNWNVRDVVTGRTVPFQKRGTLPPPEDLTLGYALHPGKLRSPDGLIDLVIHENRILIQDSRTGRNKARPFVAHGLIQSVAFSPDSRIVVSGLSSGTASVWDAATGWPIMPTLITRSPVSDAKFSDDGARMALLVSSEGYQVWNLDAETKPFEDLVALAHLLSGQRVDDYGFLTDLDSAEELRASWNRLRAKYPEEFSTTRRQQELWILNGASDNQFDDAYVSAIASPRIQQGALEKALYIKGMNRLEMARDEFSSLMLQDGGSSSLLTHRAQCSMGLKQWAAAIGDLNQALTKNPDDPVLLALRGISFQESHQPQKAIDDLSRSLRQFPENFNSLLYRGQARSSLRQWDAALEDFRQANLLWKRFPSQEPRLDTSLIPPRDPNASLSQIDLSPFFNAPKSGHWQTQNTAVGSLAALPEGITSLKGVPFEIRGVVQLSSQTARQDPDPFPPIIPGIPIRLSCAEIHFLYGAHLAEESGQTIGGFGIQFRDGRLLDVPLIYGENIRETWERGLAKIKLPGAVLAWTHDPQDGARSQYLYRLDWRNPDPENEIVMIHFHSEITASAPFLLGITANIFRQSP